MFLTISLTYLAGAVLVAFLAPRRKAASAAL